MDLSTVAVIGSASIAAYLLFYSWELRNKANAEIARLSGIARALEASAIPVDSPTKEETMRISQEELQEIQLSVLSEVSGFLFHETGQKALEFLENVGIPQNQGVASFLENTGNLADKMTTEVIVEKIVEKVVKVPADNGQSNQNSGNKRRRRRATPQLLED